MAGSDYTQYSSRIADANRSWQNPCKTEVANWDKSNEFIFAFIITSGAHTPDSESFSIYWQRVTGSGAPTGFVILAAGSGELRQGTNTVLVDGAEVAEATDSDCKGTKALDDGEEAEGDATTAPMTGTQDDAVEIQVAVDPSNALDGETYEFKLYSETSSMISATIAVLRPFLLLKTLLIIASPYTFSFGRIRWFVYG